MPLQGFRYDSSAEQFVEMPPIDTQFHREITLPATFPQIVTLCGSTKFWRQFQEQSLRFTMEGKIVLSIGAARAPDDDDRSFGGLISPDRFHAHKAVLDELHKRKIDISDRVFVLNVDDYIGESTRSEIMYALSVGKYVEFMNPTSFTPAPL